MSQNDPCVRDEMKEPRFFVVQVGELSADADLQDYIWMLCDDERGVIAYFNSEDDAYSVADMLNTTAPNLTERNDE